MQARIKQISDVCVKEYITCETNKDQLNEGQGVCVRVFGGGWVRLGKVAMRLLATAPQSLPLYP